MPKPKRIAIIGAGPIGLEAALAARRRGYEVLVLEAGQIADSVRRWGHARMFSPFSMNASEAGIALLGELGLPAPEGEALLTGAEYAAQYLEPLGRHLGVRTGCRVLGIARDGAGKRDGIGEPGRAGTAFRLLVQGASGESHEFADLVFDCSGTFQTPNPLGDGGLPALGETAARGIIRYGLGECGDWSVFAGKRVLIAGGGHSAITAAVELGKVKKEAPATRLFWLSKRHAAEPAARIADDPLAERDRLCAEANELAAAGVVEFHAGDTVLSIEAAAGGARVRSRGGWEPEVDAIIAATGYRPDLSLARELHVQTCWATEGAYKLAAALLGESAGDCLQVAGFGAETLGHPEPGYFALGMKSYGRTPDFLIRTGREQIASVLDALGALDAKS